MAESTASPMVRKSTVTAWLSSVDCLQGRKRMLLDGEADRVGGPTYLWGSGGMREIFYVYALKSILR